MPPDTEEHWGILGHVRKEKVIRENQTPSSGGGDTAALLVSTSARLTRLYGKVLGQLQVPLTFRQHRLLMRVGQGHTTLVALAAFGNLTLPTVSESIDVLVRRGLMTRQGNPENRRSLVLALTEDGEMANQAAQAALADVGGNLLRNVSEQERQALHRSLSEIFNAATSYFRNEQDLDTSPVATNPGTARRKDVDGEGIPVNPT